MNSSACAKPPAAARLLLAAIDEYHDATALDGVGGAVRSHSAFEQNLFDVLGPSRGLSAPFAGFANQPEIAGCRLGLPRLADTRERFRKHCFRPLLVQPQDGNFE